MLIKTPYGNVSLNQFQIASELKRETCPHCEKPDCCFDCEASVIDLQSIQSEKLGKSNVAGRLQYNGAVDGIEALLLALIPKICEQWSIEGSVYSELWMQYVVAEAVQTAMEACGNNI